MHYSVTDAIGAAPESLVGSTSKVVMPNMISCPTFGGTDHMHGPL